VKQEYCEKEHSSSSETHLRAMARQLTCCIGSHSVTCHLTQVNTPHLNVSQASL